MALGGAVLGTAFALAGAWMGPGLAVATACGLGRDRLERAVLGVALGRVFLVVVTLLATSMGAPRVLVFVAACGAAAGIWAALRTRRVLAPTDAGVGAALAVGLACALVLVVAVVSRSALERGGVLPFFGRDGANDPFVYGSYALALRDLGPPLANPFAGGAAAPGSYGGFAVLAGLSAASGASMLDLAYRVVPLVDAVALFATAVALVRALGAPRLAWLLAPLAMLAGDPSPVVGALAGGFGLPVHAIDSFALFGPYLLAMNPITPAMQTLFCALLLLARPERRHHAWVAGFLVAALFEIKLFLWAPVIAGLAATAAFRPPPASARGLRVAAAVAALASLPSIAERAHVAGAETTQFSVCLGCLPRYLSRAAWGDGALSFDLFRAGTPWAAISARLVFVSAIAATAIAAIAVGARLLALPRLVRGARGGNLEAPYRVLLCASLAGLVLAMTVAAPPHYLNAAQFAWIAVFGMAPLLAMACAEWIASRRWVPLVAALLLALPGSADAILRLGFGAQQRFSISAAERELCARLAEVSAPGDVVFEPSMIVDTDRPSAVPLLAGRPVYMSLLSAVGNLPASVRDERFAGLVAVFVGRDVGAAQRALAEAQARFVVVPAGVTPMPAVLTPLVPVFENAAGRIYRVPGSATLPP